MFRTVADAVTTAAEAGAAATLRPRSFFVAWNGVLTIVYEGFPPGLAGVKASLAKQPLPLRKENFGSKWPKTTLGALSDDSPPLTHDELAALKSLCEAHGADLNGCDVPIASISVVEYFERGLERTRRRVDLPLRSQTDPSDPEASSSLASALASAAERAVVDSVLEEWRDLPAYLPKVNAAGSRIGSYRESSPHGRTCVAFLHLDDEGDGESAASKRQRPAMSIRVELSLSERFAAFRAAVDALLPGRYCWLAPHSLHCTLRSLDSLSLEELGYAFRPLEQPQGHSDWVLRQLAQPSLGFEWKGQANYDAVGAAVTEWVHHEGLGTVCGLESLPYAAPPAMPYATKGLSASSGKPLLLLVCGAAPGGSAGVWGRALCINQTCEQGAMFDYVRRAQASGWTVVVADPHNSTSAHAHMRELWSRVVLPSHPSRVAIVAHSYGAALAISLLKAEAATALSLVHALALTDGMVWDLLSGGWVGGSMQLLHERPPGLADVSRAIDKEKKEAANGVGMDTAEMEANAAKLVAKVAHLQAMAKEQQQSAMLSPQSFATPTRELAERIAEVGCNYVASALPVGSPLHEECANFDLPPIPRLSAGHESHPSTTHAATAVLWEFLLQKMHIV